MSGFLPINPTPDPVMDPQLSQDMQAWLEALLQQEIDEEALKKLLAASYAMKNPMLAIQMIMQGIMNVHQDEISGLAAADNVDSDLRSAVTGAQNSENAAISGSNGGTTLDPKDMQNLINEIDALKVFLQSELAKIQGGVPNPFGSDPSTINNMLNAISSFQGAFGTDWGNANAMAGDMQNWVNAQMNDQISPNLKTTQDALQTLNQCSSAFSMTTGTQLQYKTEQYKQFEGIFEDNNQAYLKLITQIVQNLKST